MGLINIDNIHRVAGEVMTGLDGLFTSDEERAKAELAIQKTFQRPHILQAMTNLKSAEHASRFVAGARPALLWICAGGLGWELMGRPILESIAILFFDFTGTLPGLDTGSLISLTMALLGLGGLRTYEGVKGVKRNSLNENPLPPIDLQSK